MKITNLLILMCLTLTACVSPTAQYPEIDKAELELETKLQQDLFAKDRIKKQEKAMKRYLEMQGRLFDVAIKIQKGGADLCNKLGKAKNNNCIYEFELSKASNINAYADGKKIVVTKGMMHFAKTDEELSVVLGHEYAHNIMGHVAATKKNAFLGKMLGSVIDAVASSQGINTGSSFSSLGTYAGVMSYSKNFEKEADYIGLYITSSSDYDISSASNFWRRMSLRNGKAIQNGVTHPTNPERFLALGETIKEINRKKNNGSLIMPQFRE